MRQSCGRAPGEKTVAHITRYHARWVVPVSATPVANGTVVVEDARISYVGPRPGAPSGPDVELRDAILLPGLVNAHSHLDLTVMRGLLDGLAFFPWVRALTTVRREVLNGTDFLDSAHAGIREGLLAGITCFADTAPGDAAFAAMLATGVRGIAYREVFGPDPSQCDQSMNELRESVREMTTRRTGLVAVGVSPHAPYSVSDALFTAASTFAREHHLPLATHVAESDDEAKLVEQGEGEFAAFLRGRDIVVNPRARSPIALLERCGVLESDPLLIHCCRLSDADLSTIGARRLAVAHCPASNAYFAHSTSPVVALLQAGARVGLGTDSLASNDRMSILGEAQLAVATTGGALEPRGAVELATLGGARALNMAHEVGSLEVGKQADLTAFALPAHEAVTDDPVRALVQLLHHATAELVVIAGRVLVRHGQLIAADDGVAARCLAASQRLGDWRRRRDPSWRPLRALR